MDISAHKQTTAGYFKSGLYDKNSAGDGGVFGFTNPVFSSSSLPVVVFLCLERNDGVFCMTLNLICESEREALRMLLL